jgi:hypothetical protein
MRFIMMVKADERSEAGIMPDQKLLAAMGKYNEELIKAGVMLAGDGLKPSSEGARVRLARKQLTVKDGPFAEAKELLGGFWVIQAKSKEEAVALAKRVPFTEGEIEIRSLYEMSDFPVDPSEQPDGWRDQEKRFRDAADPSAGTAAPPARKPGTTRFMVTLKSDKLTESDALPDPKIMAAMGDLMSELVRAGALIAGEGLKPSSKGARVRFAGDKRTVIDGPFTEAKELIAGYSMIQVPSKAEAVDFARRWLEIHIQGAGLDTAEIDVRPLLEIEDFPVDPSEQPGGWRDQERRFRDGK